MEQTISHAGPTLNTVSPRKQPQATIQPKGLTTALRRILSAVTITMPTIQPMIPLNAPCTAGVSIVL